MMNKLVYVTITAALLLAGCKQNPDKTTASIEAENNRPVPMVTIWVADTADMPIKNAHVYLYSDTGRDHTCQYLADSMLTDKDGKAEFRFTKCPCEHFNITIETPLGCRKKIDNAPCRSGTIVNCDR